MSETSKTDAAAAATLAEAAAAAAALKAAEPAVDAASTKVEIEVGQTVRLAAVHGYIQHPFALTEFNVDRSVKVVVDTWHKVQYDAGKLRIDQD